MKSIFSFLALLFFTTFGETAIAQTPAPTPPPTPPPYFTTANWLRDATTIPFSHNSGSRNSFSGIRFIFEPQLGSLIQETEDRVIVENITTLSKVGLETNLFKNYVSLQALFIAPSKVQLDEKSLLRINASTPGNTMPGTKDPEGKLEVDYGFGIGLSFIDGMLAFGYAGIFYDKRDFVNISTRSRGEYQNNFFYFNIQPISVVKSLIKELKD